jgi:hypothetical protein
MQKNRVLGFIHKTITFTPPVVQLLPLTMKDNACINKSGSIHTSILQLFMTICLNSIPTPLMKVLDTYKNYNQEHE